MRFSYFLVNCFVALALCTNVSSGALVFSLEESGSDVVLSLAGGGSLNLADLSDSGTTTASPGMNAALGIFQVGRRNTSYRSYSGTIAGPTSFGTSSFTSATDSSSAVFWGIYPSNNEIKVTEGYISGNPISAVSNSFSNTTLDDLGVTLGSYVWTWGSGGNADSITLNIVPEPSTWALGLAGLAGVGSGMWRRKRRI